MGGFMFLHTLSETRMTGKQQGWGLVMLVENILICVPGADLRHEMVGRARGRRQG